jgi:hypothetical protein
MPTLQIDATGKPATKPSEFRARVATGPGGGVIRGFDGPNLAKEAVKDHAAAAFLETTAAVVAPIVEKHLARALK